MYAPKPMNFHFTPTNPPVPADGSDQARVFASTPEGLVSHGDLASLRHWIAQVGSADQQDLARNALFEAAGTGLVQTKDGRICNMRLYGWPVCIDYSRGTMLNSVLMMANAGDPVMVLKLRELWSRAFGATSGVQISPFWVTTNLLSLLSVNPVNVRDCVRRGVSLVSGTTREAFDFEKGKHHLVEASPEVPACYMLSAYVCWEVGTSEPSLSVSPDILFELKQCVEAFFSSAKDQVKQARVGRPALFHEAITQGQGLQVAGMVRRATELGQMIGVSQRLLGDHVSLMVSYADRVDDEDPVFEQTWTYSSLWRPANHVQVVAGMMEAEASSLIARHGGRNESNGGESRNENVQFH